MQPADSFSTRLEVCYEVLLYLASRMQHLAPGETMEFVSCDPHAHTEILNWVELRDYELLEVEALPDGQTRFLMRR